MSFLSWLRGDNEVKSKVEEDKVPKPLVDVHDFAAFDKSQRAVSDAASPYLTNLALDYADTSGVIRKSPVDNMPIVESKLAKPHSAERNPWQEQPGTMSEGFHKVAERY